MYLQAQRKGQSYILLTLGRMGTAGRIHRKKGGKRVCGRFRSKYAFGQQERCFLCRIGDHEEIEESDDGANKRKPRVHVKELDLFVTVMLLEETPTVLSLEKVLRTRHPPKKARKSSDLANHVPFVVPGLSTSSSTLSSHASATSSSHYTVISTKYPATEGSEIMGEGSRGSPSHESAETENK